MTNRLPDVKDPITAYLAMYIDLIKEADSELATRLNAFQAEGYLNALYDIGRLPAPKVEMYRTEIHQMRANRLSALAGRAADLDRDIQAIEEEMRSERDEQ